ncbi:MAG: DUF502 domain-containing protein [Gemmatimonadota bacterium]
MRASLKKSFITGVFAIVPLVISLALIVWFFRKVDSLFSPVIDGIVRAAVPGTEHIPGTGILAGLVIILGVGFFARHVAGERVLAALDGLIHRIPGYRTVYATVKQLTDAFSPDSKSSFKEVVLVEYPRPGSRAIGFRTGTVERDGERLAVVFVPTNNLYLGEVLFVPEEEAGRLDMTVEQAVRVLVSGGIASPEKFSPPRQGPNNGA